jgi:hypothetical protein
MTKIIRQQNMKNRNYFIILIFIAINLMNCKSRPSNGGSQINEYFKEIQDPESFKNRRERRLYYLVMHLNGNKIEGIVDSNNNCLNRKNPILFKTHYTYLDDSIIFKTIIYQSTGLKRIDLYKGILKNDSLILKKFNQSLLDKEYSYIKTITYIKCR